MVPQRVHMWQNAFKEWLSFRWTNINTNDSSTAIGAKPSSDDDVAGAESWRHFCCLILVLPLLEQALRRLYVYVNKLPLDKLLTAGNEQRQ